MKKFLLAAAVLMASASVSAQNEVGKLTIAPTVGINLSDVTKTDGSKSKFGIAAGVVAEYGVSEKLGVSVGLIYSQQGCKFKGGGGYDLGDFDFDYEDFDFEDFDFEDYEGYGTGSSKQKLDYLNIPILANYYIIDGLAIKAGVQPAVLVSATGSKKYFNTFEVSIPVGASYEYKNFVFDARYNIGLTKINKKKYSDSKANNSVFQFTLGYKFSL